MKMRNELRRLLKSRDGTVAIVFALTAFLVLLSLGLAVDGARAYNVSNRVSAALDAAALAAGKMLDDENNSTEAIESRAKAFLQAQLADAPVSGIAIPDPVVRVNRNTGEVDISVNVSVATTFAQLAGIPRLNFPRASRVRFDQRTVELSMVLDITGSMCTPCSKIDGLKSAARELVSNILTPSTTAGSVKVAIAPYSASVNAGAFADTVSGGESSDGCVVERTGPQNATDRPPQGGNALGTSSRARNGQYACPTSPIMPLSSDPAALTAHIDALDTGGFTAGHIGLAWGWYLLSPRWNGVWPGDSRPKASTQQAIKAVLLMTDGEFNTSYIVGRGKNSTDVTVANSSPEQAARLCNNMKAEGILVYSVAFQAPAAAQSLLRACATSSSHYFGTDNNQELVAAFRTIAERLLALRITR
jgi:Flp pilus assembly protein TadG